MGTQGTQSTKPCKWFRSTLLTVETQTACEISEAGCWMLRLLARFKRQQVKARNLGGKEISTQLERRDVKVLLEAVLTLLLACAVELLCQRSGEHFASWHTAQGPRLRSLQHLTFAGTLPILAPNASANRISDSSRPVVIRGFTNASGCYKHKGVGYASVQID